MEPSGSVTTYASGLEDGDPTQPHRGFLPPGATECTARAKRDRSLASRAGANPQLDKCQRRSQRAGNKDDGAWLPAKIELHMFPPRPASQERAMAFRRNAAVAPACPVPPDMTVNSCCDSDRTRWLGTQDWFKARIG